MYVLESARLQLRRLTLDDVDDLLELWGDPQAMRYYPAPYTRAQVQALVQHQVQSYQQHGYGLWGVLRKADGVFLGDCGLLRQPVEGQTMLEISYHIKRRFGCQGIATEAACRCRDYALHTLQAEHVVSIVGLANIPSRRVAAKVHRHMREFFWEKIGQRMCLYRSERDA